MVTHVFVSSLNVLLRVLVNSLGDSKSPCFFPLLIMNVVSMESGLTLAVLFRRSMKVSSISWLHKAENIELCQKPLCCSP